jgi:hypothetical protein
MSLPDVWVAIVSSSAFAVGKFPTFHGTKKFIIMFTRTRYWSESWAISIQSTTSCPVSVRIALISCHLLLVLPTWLFPSGFPTKHSRSFLIIPTRATCTSHRVLRNCIVLIIFGVEYNHEAPLCSIFSSLLSRHSSQIQAISVLRHPQSVLFA